MTYTVSEVLQFIQENDVKFIRLAFCDILGKQKNISIMPNELPRAFTNGISFDASAIQGFMNIEESDLFLFPDPSTLSILPWRPSHGRVVRFFCDIKHPDGTPFEGNGRDFLKNAIKAAEEKGYVCKFGAECEFYLFKTDEDGNPTYIPYDNGSYCDIAPLDKCENIRREICLNIEEMGMQPESSHHEQGPGQNEIDFKYSDALTSADNLVTFKSAVKTIAASNGLYASFMPKPIENKSGNGLHINVSLYKNSSNIFRSNTASHNQEAESFIAGILMHVKEMTSFLNPLTNSYKRFGAFEAPKYISWSHQNRSQLIRIPADSGELSRMELRSSDPACNPYWTFGLIIYAGLYGIENNLKLPEPCDFNLYNADKDDIKHIDTLPENLFEALEITKQSDFITSLIPPKTLEKYISIKYNEYLAYTNADDKNKVEKELYFDQI
ncbi:glutamine synthetase family protein [Eubacterium ventriosum]|uniref:glutamine synthetase family protein n=1 Tax=Eubacterium ventriosum TaxID=39496 RepID=UPI003522E065